ncbi:permease [Hamadaea sp. NPDC051192]|uniref:SCO7613 C-terminal domain-containing membrane protein n=1 Tax=Hamadaea sp. NPDC051192 TaxID=3154940 RepID=UPI003427E033
MEQSPCSMCGRLRDPLQRCPHCGNTAEVLEAELARVNKAISDLNTQDMGLVSQRKKLSQQLQAAMHQRNLLSHAVQKQQAKAQAPRQRRFGRKSAEPAAAPTPPSTTPTTSATTTAPPGRKAAPGRPSGGTPSRPPGAATSRPAGAAAGGRPPGAPRQRVAPLQTPPPETSPRTVQNVLLVLGGLMIGVAAVVYAAFASGLRAGGGLLVLSLVTVAMLVSAFLLIRVRLVSTAETLTTVGLLLLPVDGYLLAQLPPIATSAASWSQIAGAVFAVTALVSLVIHRVTLLSSARYGVVLFFQPVLPLLAYDWIKGPAGLALIFAVLALGNAMVARAVELSHREPLQIGGEHPIRHPQVLEGAWSSFWLRELAWSLHGVAVLAGVSYGLVATWQATDAPSAARGGATLLLSCAVGLLGALMVRTKPLPDVAAGALTLAWIVVAGRVAALAAPGQTLLVLAGALVVTGLAIRVIPASARRGPQIASTVAVAAVGAFVLGQALRAALGPIRAGLPIWTGRTPEEYQAILHSAGSGAGPSLVGTVALAAVAAGLALPPSFRREVAVGGAALAGLAAPASLLLTPSATLWVLTAVAIGIAAVGIGVGSVQVSSRPEQPLTSDEDEDSPPAQPDQRPQNVFTRFLAPRSGKLADQWFGAPEPQRAIPGGGLGATTPRSARAHAIAAAAVGLVAILASLNAPGASAGVLAAITAAGVILALAQRVLPTPEARAGRPVPRRPVTQIIGDTCAGAAAFAAPSAVAATIVTLAPGVLPSVPLIAAALTASGTLGYVAIRQVAHREIGLPIAIGSGLGALVITLATFGAEGAGFADTLVATLLLVAAVLLILSSSIDTGIRADRMYDGADYAAAMVVAGAIAAVTRGVSLVLPDSWLVAAALMVLAAAAGIRSMPPDWRRGPVLGASAAGLVVLLIAGYPALIGGLQAVTVEGGLWSGDLASSAVTESELGWQGPLALLALAGAAAIGMPRPRNYDAAAVCVGLATVGTPAALHWPWWSPVVLGLLIAAAYAISAPVAKDPRAGYARIAVAIALAFYAVGAALVRPWTTAAALGVLGLVSLVVLALAAYQNADMAPGDRRTSHLGTVGGIGAVGVLLAAPAAVAVLAYMVHGGRSDTRQIVLTAALATVSVGLALAGAARNVIAGYLGWVTVGVSVAGTAIAIGEVTGPRPTGVFAATAVLLAVLSELLRAPTVTRERPLSKLWSQARDRWRLPDYPAAGAFAAAVLPALLAIVALWPLLVAALTKPFQTIGHIWEGVPEATANAASATGPSAALTALLLTAAAGLAAIGFGGGANRAVARVTPVFALALLIIPYAMRLSWNSATLAGLTVFTVCMLGVALTEPPTEAESDRSLRTARVAIVLMGLIGGNAGLAGALATPEMTIFTFGGAVAVGATAALGGKTQLARILGWLGAAVAGELFMMSISLHLGLTRFWTALGVLAVGAVLIIGAALLPRFAKREARPEAAAVEWAGQFAALIALALALESPVTVGVLLAAWSAVLGIAAGRPTHTENQRRAYFWASAGSAIAAWWLFAQNAQVAQPEAYTLPFALVVLLVGAIELRRRPDLGSRAAFTPGLVAAFGPTLVLVLVKTDPVREGILLVAAVATVIYGSMKRERAPIEVGTIVAIITALHALTLAFSAWVIMIPLGILALVLGANSERRRRLSEGLQKMR